MPKDIYVPTSAHPANPDGAELTTFLRDARELTPDLFALATSKTVTITVEENVEGWGECYHLHFEEDLTEDERTLVLLVAQGNTFMDNLLRGARAATKDNDAWIANVEPQIVQQAQTIIDSTAAGVSASDKALAKGVKALAAQVADLSKQNEVLIRWMLGLFSDGA